MPSYFHQVLELVLQLQLQLSHSNFLLLQALFPIYKLLFQNQLVLEVN